MNALSTVNAIQIQQYFLKRIKKINAIKKKENILNINFFPKLNVERIFFSNR